MCICTCSAYITYEGRRESAGFSKFYYFVYARDRKLVKIEAKIPVGISIKLKAEFLMYTENTCKLTFTNNP